MKKIIIALLFAGMVGVCKADPTATPIGDQVLLSLLNHVTAVAEQTTHGQIKVQFLDSLVQFGHFKGDYIFALDGGVSNSLASDGQGKLASTFGIHVHVISGIVNGLDINPSLASTLQLLELNPRYSYDADVHHGVLGICFGARIPF